MVAVIFPDIFYKVKIWTTNFTSNMIFQRRNTVTECVAPVFFRNKHYYTYNNAYYKQESESFKLIESDWTPNVRGARSIDISSIEGYESFEVGKDIFLSSLELRSGYHSAALTIETYALSYDSSTGIVSIGSGANGHEVSTISCFSIYVRSK